jgi:hypothetical protein
MKPETDFLLYRDDSFPSGHVIRYNLDMSIVDIKDCFSLLFRSDQSALNARNRYIRSEDKHLVVWRDSSPKRALFCTSIKCMVTVLRSMRNEEAHKLATKLSNLSTIVVSEADIRNYQHSMQPQPLHSGRVVDFAGIAAAVSGESVPVQQYTPVHVPAPLPNAVPVASTMKMDQVEMNHGILPASTGFTAVPSSEEMRSYSHAALGSAFGPSVLSYVEESKQSEMAQSVFGIHVDHMKRISETSVRMAEQQTRNASMEMLKNLKAVGFENEALLLAQEQTRVAKMEALKNKIDYLTKLGFHKEARLLVNELMAL